MSAALKVGDKVRVVAWPPELRKAEMHAETIRFYERIIEERVVLEIHRVDPFGIPFGEVTIVTNGREEYHSVGLNHSEVEVVQRCATSSREQPPADEKPLPRYES